MSPSNLLHPLPASLPQEVSDILATGAGVRIERIVSYGQRSPDDFWYDQSENEWVAVLAGAAQLRFEDGLLLQMQAGDHVEIVAGRRHRVEWTAPDLATVWLAVFYRPISQDVIDAR